MSAWVRWEIGARQRIRLGRKEHERAATSSLPQWAQNDWTANWTNEFFRGVALLHADPPRADEAVAIYERLLKEAGNEPSYAVNLFAARTSQLIHGRKHEDLASEERDALLVLIDEGETMMASFSVAQRASIEQTYQVNRVMIFLALQDWRSLLEAFHALPAPLQTDPELISYAAQALECSCPFRSRA